MSISYVPGTALCTGDTAMNILIAEKQKITKKLINHEENESYDVTFQLQSSRPIRIFFISGGYDTKLSDMTLKINGYREISTFLSHF